MTNKRRTFSMLAVASAIAIALAVQRLSSQSHAPNPGTPSKTPYILPNPQVKTGATNNDLGTPSRTPYILPNPQVKIGATNNDFALNPEELPDKSQNSEFRFL